MQIERQRVWSLAICAALITWIIVGAGCIRSSLVSCDDGRFCGVGLVCDDVHQGCINPEQMTACEAKGTGDVCDLDGALGAGRCFDGVCLLPGCGNRVIEAGEICDDGNRASGDGCSDLCTSAERCSDGRVDPTQGEQCDDGNLENHDGCSSTCQPETLNQSFAPIAPAYANTDQLILDEASGDILYLSCTNTSSTTWVRHLGNWQRISTLERPCVSARLFFDSDHREPIMLMRYERTSARKYEVYAWRGQQWQLLGDGGNSQYPTAFGFMDIGKQRLIFVGQFGNSMGGSADYTSTTLSLDSASPNYLKMQPGAALPKLPSDAPFFEFEGFYDRTANQGVVVGTHGGLYTWHDDQWFQLEAPGTPNLNDQAGPVVRTQHVLLNDVAGNQTVAISAFTTSCYYFNCTDETCEGGCTAVNHGPQVWNGTRFEASSRWPEYKLFYGTVVPIFDAGLRRPVVFSGTEVVEMNAANMWERDTRLDFARGATVIAGPQHQLFSLAYDGVAPQNGGKVNVALDVFQSSPAYDPLRQVLTRTVNLTPSSIVAQMLAWSNVLDATPPWQPMGLMQFTTAGHFVWNPRRQAMTFINRDGSFEMTAQDTDWRRIADGNPIAPGGGKIYFDRTCECLTDGNAQLLDGAANWQVVNPVLRDFSSCAPWTAARGGLCRLGRGVPIQLSEYLVRGATYTTLPPLPSRMTVDYQGFHDDPHAGLLATANLDGMTGVLTYQYQSDTTLACAPDAGDTDGDGLIACQDPDCWWQCTPACPADVSCQ